MKEIPITGQEAPSTKDKVNTDCVVVINTIGILFELSKCLTQCSILFLCDYVVYMFMLHSCVCVCANFQRPEEGVRCLSPFLSPLLPWDRVSHWTGSWLGFGLRWGAGQWAPDIFLCLPQMPRIQAHATMANFMGTLGFQLRTMCLFNKHSYQPGCLPSPPTCHFIN